MKTQPSRLNGAGIIGDQLLTEAENGNTAARAEREESGGRGATSAEAGRITKGANCN